MFIKFQPINILSPGIIILALKCVVFQSEHQENNVGRLLRWFHSDLKEDTFAK